MIRTEDRPGHIGGRADPLDTGAGARMKGDYCFNALRNKVHIERDNPGVVRYWCGMAKQDNHTRAPPKHKPRMKLGERIDNLSVRRLSLR